MSCKFFYLVLFMYPVNGVSSSDPLNRAALRSRQQTLGVWLENVGLGETLGVIRLRFARHPDPAQQRRKIYRLELHFNAPGLDQDQAHAQFEALNQQFRERFGVALTSKLFHKLIHSLEVPRNMASVHSHIGNIDVGGTPVPDIDTDEDTLRTHVLPHLKPYGIESKKSVGYRIPASTRN